MSRCERRRRDHRRGPRGGARGRGRRHRRRHRPVARAGGRHGVLHDRGPQPAGGGRAGGRAADRRRVDHRHRPLQRRLRRREGRARAGVSWRARSRRGSCAPRSSTSSSAQLRGVGHRRATSSYVPKMRTQLVAARTRGRGARRARHPTPRRSARRSPRSPVPREEILAEVAELLVGPARRAAADRGRERPRRPGPRLYESGALLPGPGATLAGPTFEEWLATG